MGYAYTLTIMKGFPHLTAVTLDGCREQCAKEHLLKTIRRTRYKTRKD